MSKRMDLFIGKLRASYWFIPGLMTCGAAVGAFFSLKLDHLLQDVKLPGWLMLFSGGPDAARDVLSAVAGSIITVAGVTFSISIVILSLASQQYGPRLLRNFMRDRAIHVSFGTFVTTFVFSLLILPSTLSEHENGQQAFTPRLGVTLSIALAIGSVFMLIYFIHHIAASIQASHIAAATCDELLDTIQEIYGHKPADGQTGGSQKEIIAQNPTVDSILVRSEASGYVQACNVEDLILLARKHDVKIEIVSKAGSFLARNDRMARVFGGNLEPKTLTRAINSAFVLSAQRTMEQDPEFGFRMLIEMAVRALSPSLNDPYTALQCIDYLRVAFKAMMELPIPSPFHRDAEGFLRVVYHSVGVADVLPETISALHHYGRDSPMVLKGLDRMLASLQEDSPNAEISEKIAMLRENAS